MDDGDIGGLAVHMGSRITGLADPEHDILVGSGLELIPNGTHRLRGVPGEWPIYALGDRRNGGGTG